MTPSPPPYVVLTKEVGITPLEAIETWKKAHPEYTDVPASYAGRLDPMATGLLLVVLGDECKKAKQYQGLDKEYEVEVLLDIETDTGDILGLPAYSNKETSGDRVSLALSSVKGTHTVPYPIYSSKTIHGKPLFQYALEGTLSTIEIPTHTETVYQIHLIETSLILKSELQKRIASTLSLVPTSNDPRKVLGADFRQDEIRDAWDTVFATMPERSFTLAKIRVTCASGTYMRTLANRIACVLDTKGMALSIHRTRIGKYQTLGPLGFWRKRYR